jgi:DNA polymerase-3 subunit gamma/tau
MTYQVLARAWRPQRFEEILGQDAVVQTLRNALSSGTLGHAYLFSGLRGVGKTTAARLLAKAVNCVEGPTPEPCGHCVSCREIADGSSLDAVELDAATHTGVDDVRDLQELLRFRPTRDRYRVVIVDEVHMLSKAAFNALLKSIEEPPPYVLWVFATTERHKVPATILSRCQQLEFRPVASEVIAARLVEIADHDGFSLERSAAEAVARAAEGSVRDALSLLDQLRAFASDRVDDDAVASVLGVPRFEVIVELVEALAAGQVGAGLALVRRELAAGHDTTVLYREVGRVLRTMVHLVVDPEVEVSLTEDQRDRLRPLAGGLGVDAITRMLGLWVEQEPLLRDAGNRELALEVAALRLSRWPAVVRLEELLAGSPGEPSAASQAGGTGSHPPPAKGGGSPSSDPGSRLASTLWEDHQPRLASAVEHAEVVIDDRVVVLRFAPEAHAFATFAKAPSSIRALESACASALDGARAVRIDTVTAASDGAEAEALQRGALEDPQLDLARRVLGGDVVSVRPDRDPA